MEQNGADYNLPHSLGYKATVIGEMAETDMTSSALTST